MSLTGNPIALFRKLNQRAMGFSLQPVAVDLGHSHLIVLEVDKKPVRPSILHFHLEPRPSTPEAISERLRLIFKERGLNSKRVRVALKGQGVVIRILTFPQMKRQDFADSLQYEVEKYIPFRANEVVMDFQILNENIQRGKTGMMEVLLVVVRQAEIYGILKLFQNADLEVELVDISAFAFANLVESISPEAKEAATGFLDMGSETSTFGILAHGRPIFIRDISFGGIDILKLLKRKLGLEVEEALAIQGDPSKLKPEYQAVVEQGLASLLTELKLSIGYYMDRVPGAEALQLLILGGGGSRFIFDPKLLERDIKVPTKRLDFLSQIDISSGVDEASLRKSEDLLPVALGLCLR